jgi:hypothetical protein
LITKRAPNSFLGTDLEQTLRDLDVEEVVVAGMMTSMCVDATTRAGADLGFKMTLVPDACAAPGLEFGGRRVDAQDVHASFVAALGQFYAHRHARGRARLTIGRRRRAATGGGLVGHGRPVSPCARRPIASSPMAARMSRPVNSW